MFTMPYFQLPVCSTLHQHSRCIYVLLLLLLLHVLLLLQWASCAQSLAGPAQLHRLSSEKLP